MSSLHKKTLLRFITCGSVDDGKSTLIGRILFDCKAIFDDQLENLQQESRHNHLNNESLDFSLLVDGLQAEREQGITIDVAYRFFSTAKRQFIVADTPGHEQYTRNMATGASTASLAIILVDAKKGILEQTRRHSHIVSMMGIKHIILAINKMDLVNFSEDVFINLVNQYSKFSQSVNLKSIYAIPVSGLKGDNIAFNSQNTPWYDGLPLLGYLEEIETESDKKNKSFRMPVQYVNRRNSEFRGFCGRIVEGEVNQGEAATILPSGVRSKIKKIILGFDEVKSAIQNQSITLFLDSEVDVSRGDVIASATNPPETADQFEATLLWMTDHQMWPGRQYLLKLAYTEVTATITEIKYQQDVNTGVHLAAKTLSLNEIGRVNLSTSKPIAFDSYQNNRNLGGFILIDKLTFETVGAGMIDFALRRSSNIHWQALEINKEVRASLKCQIPCCVWFTGLSGSGKSTIANLLEKCLFAKEMHTYLLDGDNVRHGLNRDLGFTEVDRVENIRRVAEVAKLMVDAGLIVLVSFISPFRNERAMARDLFRAGEFIEVFVNTPIDVCEQRDVKGLYAKARSGQLKNFTGIDSPYEVPVNPEIVVDTAENTAEACVEKILHQLTACKFIA